MLPIGQLLGIINFETVLWGVIIWFSMLSSTTFISQACLPQGMPLSVGHYNIPTASENRTIVLIQSELP